MKKIFTLALLVITYTTFAHPNDGKVSVTNLSSNRIVVEVDGKQVSNRANDSDDFLLIPAVSTGFHAIKVYSVPNKSTVSYGIKKQTLIFQKNMNVRPQYHIDIVINRFGRVLFDELSMKDPNYVNTDNNNWNDDRDRNPGRNPDRPDRNPPGRDTYPDNDNKYGRPMSDQSFAALKATLTNERFDNSRVTIAKQVIDQNYFTADQVKQLLQMYSFDNYKLDLAKYAYKNTVNKQDYFILYEVFSFSSSKDDLANFIRTFK